MAVDVCTEISSPRISFSYDLKELDFVPIEENHNRRSDSLPTVDFDFCIGHGFHHQISSADELFANGKILPVQIKQPGPIRKNGVVSGNRNTKKKKRLVEFLSSSNEEEEDDDGIEKPTSSSKPFWQFRRSSSSADNENGRANGLLRLRSLQFLTRSNSTGSVPNPKPSGFSKAIQKQHSLREGSINYRSNSSLSSAFNQYYYPYNNINNNNNNNTTSNKPSLRKSTSRSYGGNGVRINPVLNIPPAYIAKGTVSLFGSFFGSKKSKKKR
ncbi:hypothetical protein PHJA_000610700 [Phtheirospermum japonicum]|uniref:Uncharacterized protein n=1 Tax=Phtheirospermum japonicum TaxID=374723 RepID=A0A830BHS0_9LAMI|nr:hypothetical protein PHJA_000610700 [Phtheirospermum japonicum]